MTEGSPLTFTATATDTDLPANTLTYSLSGAPAGATINASTGIFTWTPTEAQGPGSYTFDVVVSDGSVTDSETITVTVNEANDAPVLAAIGNQTVTEGTVLSFTASATDPDLPANTLTFSLSGAPAGATINASTGIFTWTPTEAQGPGSYVFDVVVSDGSLTDSETITVTVIEVNDAPTVALLITDQSATEDSVFSFTFAAGTFSDVDTGDSLTYSATGLPTWLSFDALTRTFTGTPANADVGSATVTVRATDLAGLYIEDQFVVTVTPVNDAPTATNLDRAQTYTEDTPLPIDAIVVSDIDSTSIAATLTLSDPAAGSLNTSSSGAVVSTYNAATGVWRASGAIADVNALLANLTFAPAADYNNTFTIASNISDGIALPVTGNKVMTGTPVNDAPSGNVTITGTPMLGQLLIAGNTLADADGIGTLAYQWLRDMSPVAGATASTYALGPDDVGGRMSVRVGYADGHGSLESVLSLPTAAIGDVREDDGDHGTDTVIPPIRPEPTLPPTVTVTPPESSADNAKIKKAGSAGQDLPAFTRPMVATIVPVRIVVEQPNRDALPSLMTAIDDFRSSDDEADPVIDEISLDYLWRTAYRTMQGLSSRSTDGEGFESPVIGDEQAGYQWSVELSTAQTAGISLSVGVVWWSLRAGGLLASLAASMPVWRSVDVTMIADDRQVKRDRSPTKASREAT